MENSKPKEPVFYTLPNEQDFLAILHSTYDENDPRSVNYKRVHVIPEINWRQAANHIVALLLLGLFLAVIVFASLTRIAPNYAFKMACILPSIGIFLYMLMRAKAMTIWVIHVYQRFAPINIRNKCRFEPSCSSYMIQAIEKYGVVKGIFQGIQRLRRCNVANGGYDDL
ncbi:membrane protein insertion efficiency factor YidD [Paenibacillus oryzisoli]|uniref:membrane protein insertion efficiency factor YidD n=1 Tax=Paenibacillus oryzisoli TaxID=1850517 RepID=UPI003D2B2D75